MWFGRPEKRRPPDAEETLRLCGAGEMTKKEAAAKLRVSRGTLNKWLRDGGGAAGLQPCTCRQKSLTSTPGKSVYKA